MAAVVKTIRPPRMSACLNADGSAKFRWRRRSAAKSVARSQGRREGAQFAVYRCPNCDGYHVAHR